MRKILIPEAITTIDGKSFGLREFVRFLLDSDNQFNDTGNHIRSAVRIERALEVDDGALCLEEADWKLLKDVAEKPSAGYPRLIGEHTVMNLGRRCVPFVEAIDEASEAMVTQVKGEDPKNRRPVKS